MFDDKDQSLPPRTALSPKRRGPGLSVWGVFAERVDVLLLVLVEDAGGRDERVVQVEEAEAFPAAPASHGAQLLRPDGPDRLPQQQQPLW